MTSVMGLDMSCNASGVACPTGRTLTIKPDTKVVAPRLHFIAGAIVRLVRTYQPDLVVIENYAQHSAGILSTIRLAEVGGVVRCHLYELGVPYVEIENTALKRWATGNGGASKEQMIDAAESIGVELTNPKAHDEADAYLCRAVGLMAMDGIDPFLPERRDARLDVISNLTWPTKEALRAG